MASWYTLMMRTQPVPPWTVAPRGPRAAPLGLRCAAAVVVAACASREPPPAAAPLAAPAVPPVTARTVSAIVLVNNCASLGPVNARLAEKAINQLVDGCSSLPGGGVRFVATLLPGGTMQFESRGDGSELIPICVLSHPLTHGVHLQKSCSLDVQLEAASFALPAR